MNIMCRTVCRRRLQDPAAVPLPGVCGQQPGGPVGSAQAAAAVQVPAAPLGLIHIRD